MAQYGLKDYGFDRPTYEQWFAEYKNKFKETFGLTENIQESTLVNDLLTLFAYQDIKLWETLESVYSSQTLNGAEGIYLDEVLSRRGVFRKGATQGSGIAIIKTNRSAPWNTSIPTTSIFSGTNDTTYKPDVATEIRDKVTAFKLPLTDFGAATSVTFEGRSSSDSSDSSITLNPQDAGFLTSLETWMKDEVFVEDNDLISIDSDILYVGFNTTDYTTVVGVDNPTYMFASLKVGDKWSGVTVTAVDEGVYPLEVDGLSSITPTSYVVGATTVSIQDVTNFDAFASGADSETDAQYRARFNRVVDEATSSTKPAIRSALLALDGVSKVRIYDNSSNVAETEAPALSFHTIVLGGTAVDIAQTLYDTKPINTHAYGSVDTVIDTLDGGTETVGFSYADQVQLNVKIDYTTQAGRALSSSQTSTIKSNLSDLAANFVIGGKVFNSQLQSTVFSALGFNSLVNLSVQVKKTTDPDSAYTSLDYNTQYNEIALIDAIDVLFEQSL